ncbi:MAG: nucleotidyltransferase family protein [Anaerolineae bacterium]|nr:nucleotidyltransferase family protein [Anaerolineae bacterium]
MSETTTQASKNITIPKEAIADFCRRHHIRKLALFGSVLRGDFTPESDVDVLVEFEPDAIVGLFKFIEIQDELSTLLGREVDLNTAGFLSRHFRQKVLEMAEAVYG